MEPNFANRSLPVNRTSHIRLMASYNTWMNARLYEAAATLPADVLAADKKAFFRSILGTLHHIQVGDTFWLKRFAAHPAGHAALDPLRALPMPASVDPFPAPALPQLWEQRGRFDQVIEAWAGSLTEADLDHVLTYSRSNGEQITKDFFSLVMHFFNHQTHHRGQATTLLSQEGIDVGSTDLLQLIPNR